MKRTRRGGGVNQFAAIDTLKLGEAAFFIRAGLIATMTQAENAASTLVNPAYRALAETHGFKAGHPDDMCREAVLRRLQQAWYDTKGGEPDRVRARREALYERLKAEPVGPVRRVRKTASALTTAYVVRKALLEGKDTEAVVVAAQAVGLDVTSRTVAYYKHKMRKKGEL